MNKLSHIETVRKEQALIKMQVQNLLGWDDMQYASFQEEMGLVYLRKLFGEGTPMIQEVPSHKGFWSWWKMHWLKRDREFLDMAGLLFRDEVLPYYEDLHHPAGIAFTPHRAILEKTYHGMIHKLVKEVVK